MVGFLLEFKIYTSLKGSVFLNMLLFVFDISSILLYSKKESFTWVMALKGSLVSQNTLNKKLWILTKVRINVSFAVCCGIRPTSWVILHTRHVATPAVVGM